MVVRPCLTRVDVIIARGLLGATAQELVYLPDHFQNQASHACSRQEDFQFYVLDEVCVFFKLPISFPRSHSLLFLSLLFFLLVLQFFFQLQDRCNRRLYPCSGIPQAVRAMHDCPAFWKRCFPCQTSNVALL